MLERNELARLVAARLEDFASPSAAWPRRLWTPGLIATLKEVLIAARARQEGLLAEASLRNACNWGKSLLVNDPAVPTVVREELKRSLNGLAYDHTGYHYLNASIADLEENYLRRWAESLAAESPPRHELAARSIIGHLLHKGYSRQHIGSWFAARIGDPDRMWELGELIHAAHTGLAEAPEQEYDVVLPLIKPGAAVNSPNWLAPGETAAWAEANGVPSIRQNGALRVTIQARDRYAAVARMADVADRLVARGTVLGGSAKFQPHTKAWVGGAEEMVPLRQIRRIHVGALERIGDPTQLQPDPVIDSAIELAAPLQRESPAAAVAGAWACMESLLAGAGEETITVADKMAALIACSLPRAEWTTLARRHSGNNQDQLAREIDKLHRNKEKAARALSAHQEGARFNFPSDSDDAALLRLVEISSNPRQTLERISGYLGAALRRLYMYRNMVLHGGRLDNGSTGLRSTLDAAAPLIGAGLDRIVHAWLEREESPKSLAGKAQYRRTAIASAEPQQLLELLE